MFSLADDQHPRLVTNRSEYSVAAALLRFLKILPQPNAGSSTGIFDLEVI
jgi:hypothetical protein